MFCYVLIIVPTSFLFALLSASLLLCYLFMPNFVFYFLLLCCCATNYAQFGVYFLLHFCCLTYLWPILCFILCFSSVVLPIYYKFCVFCFSSVVLPSNILHRQPRSTESVTFGRLPTSVYNRLTEPAKVYGKEILFINDLKASVVQFCKIFSFFYDVLPIYV